jgi:hypothetical protein
LQKRLNSDEDALENTSASKLTLVKLTSDTKYNGYLNWQGYQGDSNQGFDLV